MAKIKVKVKAGVFPVRYNGERYAAGDVVSIEDKHFNASVFEKVEATKVKEVTEKAE
ncbi:hypothetical protein V6C27_02920 [Peptococcaceae bacterium 1198_IL3148]